MSQSGKILLVGLPGSGKTTFLAAIWHVLTERGNRTGLKLSQLGEDRTYLNQIAKEWRECSQVPRTNLQTNQIVLLHLDSAEFGEFDLAIPDLSGEAYEEEFTERRITLRNDEFMRDATGVILFVHPDVQKGTQISQVVQLEAAINSTKGRGESTTGSITPWSVEKIPTQVKLVELLQIIFERVERKLRVALVISAWDLVDSLGAPQEVLARQLPLLRQFLDANDDLLEYVTFGISAQGGDITLPEEKRTLLELDDAVKRIKVRQSHETSNDISKPIAWLLGSK